MTSEDAPTTTDFSQFFQRYRRDGGTEREVISDVQFDSEAFEAMFGKKALGAFSHYSHFQTDPTDTVVKRQLLNESIITLKRIVGVDPSEIYKEKYNARIEDV